MPGQVIGYVRVSTVDQNPERQIVAHPDRPRRPNPIAGSPTTPRVAAPTAQHWRPCSPTSATRTSSWCASMDRLARSVVDLDQLVSRLTGRGVTIRFLKEGLTFQAAGQADPLAVFQLQVMGAFAQLERALIRDRQREGIEAAKARGVYRGRARRLTPAQVAAAQAELTAGVPKAVVARRPRRGPPDPLQRSGRGRYIESAGRMTRSVHPDSSETPGSYSPALEWGKKL